MCARYELNMILQTIPSDNFSLSYKNIFLLCFNMIHIELTLIVKIIYSSGGCLGLAARLGYYPYRISLLLYIPWL